MFQTSYNPDVLSCLANLSNDEVFTSPALANKVLDLLPEKIWSDKSITFLDPVCKTGVFLREITKRLITGLEKQIPDRQKRINHILTRQVYGIAITELTSLMSRRTVYCSKKANSKYSVCTEFTTEQGNIIYKKMKHTWDDGRCVWCGASQEVYDREEVFESYAYNFIHVENPEKLFNMKFDVIIGNPPYQLTDGGAQKSAIPIYHRFVEQAIKLCPGYLIMIIPARWYNGGKGLDLFREQMLNDSRISELHDFPDTSDCFPGLNIRGGVCYFLWDKTHNGHCRVFSHKESEIKGPVVRPLLEKNLDIFIRYSEGISILDKVRKFNETTFDVLVSARKPFGLATNFKSFKVKESGTHNILLYRFGNNAYIESKQVEKNHHYIDSWKVFVPYSSPGDDSYPHLILSKPIVAGPKTACTETYLVVGPFKNKKIAENVVRYMCSSFFRFMILLAKSTQHITQKNYQLVPQQDFSIEWNDKLLYKKYNISKDEILFIESLIKPIN